MKVLVIEDDTILLQTIKQCISDIFEVTKASDGEEGLLLAEQNIYDIIILDLMLPILNGYDVLKSLRKSKIYTPVLILTAKDSIDDKVKGFKIGADDYLVKPFQREELLARLEAIIRRNNKTFGNNIMTFNDLTLNLQTREAKIGNNILSLQGKQFDMLEYLINNKNTIITKNQIFDRIWGFDSNTTTSVVEVYASGIRKELKKFEYDKYINTIRSVGYIFKEELE